MKEENCMSLDRPAPGCTEDWLERAKGDWAENEIHRFSA